MPSVHPGEAVMGGRTLRREQQARDFKMPANNSFIRSACLDQ